MGPQARSGYQTGIRTRAALRRFTFRDPDGHPLENLAFPAEKGRPKWRAPSNHLLLGIDHTAIVVSWIETSFPAGEKTNDLLQWQTVVHARSTRQALNLTLQFRAPMVSSATANVGGHDSVIIRDPDGHAIEIGG